MMLLQVWPLIDHGRAHCLDATKLRTHAQYEHHEEERHRPQMRPRHQQHRLRIGDKRQSRSLLHHLIDGHVQIVGHEAQHREHSETGKDSGKDVGHRDEHGIGVNVVVELCDWKNMLWFFFIGNSSSTVQMIARVEYLPDYTMQN